MTTANTLTLDGERLLQIARDTGLRHHLHAVSPTEARALLKTFVAAVIGGNAQPVGRAHDDGKVTWYDPIPEGGAFVYAGPVPAAAVAEETSPRKLALDILMQVADEAPINGNELAQARVLMAASRLRDEAPQVSGNLGQVAYAQPFPAVPPADVDDGSEREPSYSRDALVKAMHAAHDRGYSVGWDHGRATQPSAQAQPIARALAEWHEEDGPVLWWAWCGHEWAGEPAWCGTPLADNWPGYHTHWTKHPTFPTAIDASKDGANG